MKLTRLTSACLSATAGLAAIAGLTAGALTANAAPARTPPRIAVYDCTSQPHVRPAWYYIFCDGSRTLSKLNWSSWNLGEAVGTGVYNVDTCPDCVQAKLRHLNVVVVLWRPVPTARHASQYEYSTMTLLFPATGKTQTITLPSY